MGTTNLVPSTTPITLAVLDPLSADVTIVCTTVTAMCNLLCTPAGQKLLLAEIALGSDIQTATQKIFGGIFNGITGMLSKLKR